MAVPANFPIFANLPTGLNPLLLFDTAFGMILNGSAPVPIGSIAIGTTTVSGGTSGRVLYDNAGVVGELTVTGTGNAVLATNPALVTPNLGTPSAAVLTNATGLPIATGVSGLGAGIATFLATPTSANLAAALTDETGSGAAVFANSPALAGVPTAPTAAAATNTTQLATTAFVQTNLASYAPLAGAAFTGNVSTTDGFIDGYATTATAAGTTTLVNTSAKNQYFTGASTQTVVLPVTSTLTLGQQFRIVNNSTGGAITVQSSGGNNIVVIPQGSAAILTCILTSGTTAASWDLKTAPNGGLVLLTSGTVTSAATLDIILTSYTGYRGYVFNVSLLPTTDNVTLYGRVSANGGSSYDAGASDYRNAITIYRSNNTSLNQPGDLSFINLASQVGSAQGTNLTVTILNPASTSRYPMISVAGLAYESGATADGIGGGAVRLAAQTTNAFRFLFSSGNISGSFAVYGYM